MLSINLVALIHEYADVTLHALKYRRKQAKKTNAKSKCKNVK